MSQTTPPDILARIAEARERLTQTPVSLGDGIALDSLLADAEAEIERLHTWDGLMSLLDKHWPADVIPTLPDDDKRDAGPRIVSLLRWLDQVRVELTRANMQASEWRDEMLVERRLRERAEQDWRETAARLRRLANAAEVYAADQSRATDPRCGLVQPVTVAEAEELNQALREVREIAGKVEQ